MARVHLRNDWFAPNAEHFKRGVREIPDRLLGKLPKSAKIVTGDGPAPAAARSESLKDHDPARAAGDAGDRAMSDADKEREANAARIKAALAREKDGKK